MGNFHELLAATEPDDVTDFLRLENVVAKASGIPDSALSNPDILRKQIVEYMKYRAPIEFGMSFLDALKSFSTVGDQTAVVEAQVKAQESTQDVTQACQALITLIREYDDLVEAIDSLDETQRVLSADAAGQAMSVPLVDYDTHMSLLRDGRNNLYYHFQHLNRINLVFARYEAALCTVLRDESVPRHRREESSQEGVLVEANFLRCRNLFEMDKELFVDVCGEVHGMTDEDILHNLLLCEAAI
jgi:hypothetical protein